MIVNTRKAATSSRRHATLSKRAVKNTDGVYRLPFFFQCNMDRQDVIAAVLATFPTPAELNALVTRGQILDIVQSVLVEEGIGAIKKQRAVPPSTITTLVAAKVTQLFPDFFPKFARPRK